jgi:hypothetical protein
MWSAKVNRSGVKRKPDEVWPSLSDQSIKSFHMLKRHTVKGPARLFRILFPNSRAMSDCWVTEEMFKQLMNAPDPKAAWRRYLAVWPD